MKEAFLLAASTGESGYTPVDGDVTLHGTPVAWNTAETINNNISSVNVEADVTSIVKPIVDAASPGLVPITAAEPNNTTLIDGEILAVVFNDPTASKNNSIVLLYGAQNTTGDTFHLNLGTPIDLTNPDLSVTMGIGDSFGYQPVGQFSTINVNGKLLTSSAGGQDDCDQKYQPTPDFSQCGNGSLLTVGGIGDSTANPPDPSATDLTCGPADTPPTNVPPAPRCDDELYNLLPFVHNGDTSIQVDTDNPSNDDNIFFSSLVLNATSAIVGQGIILSPPSATNMLGAPHTVTAKVVDDQGNPVTGQLVNFKVVSGPNAGKTGMGTTDSSGLATFTYTSTAVGTDTIQATFTNAAGQMFTSNQVTKTWVTTLAPTTTTTSLSGGGHSGGTITVPQSTAVTDQATLAGTDASTAGGTVTYKVFSNSTCTTAVSSGTPITITTPGLMPPSSPVTLATAGTYYWQATYSGDTANEGSASTCGTGGEVETVTSPITTQPTTLATTLTGGKKSGSTISVPTGTGVTDQAILSGTNVGTASGSVTYRVYAKSTCAGLVAKDKVTVTGGVVPASNPVTLTTAGNYYWQATYSGNSTNGGSSSPCGSEVEKILPNPPPPKSCSGTFANPGVLAGTYTGNTTITGYCIVDGGPAIVNGDLILAKGAALNATFAQNDVAGSGTSSLAVTGDVKVGQGATLDMGCEPNAAPCTDSATLTGLNQVGGKLTARSALGVIVHASTIKGSVSQAKGGGGTNCTPPPTGFFSVIGSPVYSDYEDNQIGGSLRVSGLQSCWFGALRNRVHQDVAYLRNSLADPDASEVVSNVVLRDMSCIGNSPAVQFGDSVGKPNKVGVHATGQCSLTTYQPNPAPSGPLLPISVQK